MAEKRIVVVSEVAPQLLELESGPVRKHLRDYAAYRNRVDGEMEVPVPLKRTMDTELLDSCIQLSFNMTGVRVVRKLPEGAANAKKRKKVLTDLSLMTPVKLDRIDEEEKEKKEKKSSSRILLVGEDEDGDDDEESDSETVAEGEDQQVLYLSDAHVELMLMHALGPKDVFASIAILNAVKMQREEPFAKLSVATPASADGIFCATAAVARQSGRAWPWALNGP